MYDSQISKLIDNLKNSDSFGNFNIYKKQKYLNYKQSIQYNYLTSLLYLNLKKKILQKIFNLSDKGYLGFNDPFILIDGIKVTSDKINSLFDYEYINSFYDLTKKNIKVLEIGAGAARTSDTILTYNKNMKYIICDIPPSIFTGYIRLKKRFPKKKIIFSHNFNKNELIKAIDKNDIIFIFPDQLSLLPQNSINLTLAIDCLHEMENKNLYHIFKNVERFAENFYFSVWKDNCSSFIFI